MANVVSNLLKLTDYPFSFSFIGLLLSFGGVGNPWQNQSLIVPFVTLAGLFATGLSVTDPFGKPDTLYSRTS
jgi:hypothetical protein